MSTNTPTTEDSTATEQPSDDSEFEFETDGGVTDTDLTAFQTNILFVLAGYGRGRYTRNRGKQGAYGLGIKDVLERPEWYDEEINHGRLYPNLDTLVDHGLVAKSELDKRTNTYQLTDQGWELLRRQVQRELGCIDTPEDGDA
jgi:uncharacterized membrane-anchored protein